MVILSLSYLIFLFGLGNQILRLIILFFLVCLALLLSFLYFRFPSLLMLVFDLI